MGVDTYRDKRKREIHRSWIEQIIASAQGQKWFGKITIIIEAGTIQRVTKEESLKPPST